MMECVNEGRIEQEEYQNSVLNLFINLKYKGCKKII